MRSAHDSAKGLHFGKALALQRGISYSEWDSEAAIELYRNSDAHQEIVRHARALKGAKAEVKLYELVQ
jgi:heme-degrading monooxygenase HmoA